MIFSNTDKILLFIILVIFSSCSSNNVIEVVTSEHPSKAELLTAQELRSDLEKVTGLKVNIVDESKFCNKSKRFIIGTVNSNTLAKELLKNSAVTMSSELPGSIVGIWQKVGDHSIVLAGNDIQGMQYAVYDYSKEILGIDPMQNWTEHSVLSKELNGIFNIENKKLIPPKAWIVAWTDNDYKGFGKYANNTGGSKLHTGFSIDYTIAYPYPSTSDTIIHKMYDDYNLSNSCQVNRQQFLPFLLNMDAFSEFNRNPDTNSYEKWAQMYYPERDKSVNFNLMDGSQEIAELPVHSSKEKTKSYTAERVSNDTKTVGERFKVFQNNNNKSALLLQTTNQESAYYYDKIHYPLDVQIDY